MLILTRKIGETLIINDDIEVTVLDAGSNQIRLGKTAPEEVKVYRKELYERMQAEPPPKNIKRDYLRHRYPY